MSVNKIKSLKLQRHNESAIDLEDVTATPTEEMRAERIDKSSRLQAESSPPVHSTPKRPSTKSNNTQDQLEYRVSPILLPCTQDGGSEVAWDWHSPKKQSTTAKRGRNNGEIVGTPKRTSLLQKKRNSNSPLLYKPIKRKLMKNDNQQERIEKFTAEMKAISEQIKTVPKDEESSRVARMEDDNIEVTEDELLVQIDIDDFVETETGLVTTIGGSSKNLQTHAHKRSLDDLFDDSIDDSMVKCSQEVEEKLRLESCRERSSGTNSNGNNAVKDFSWHQRSYTSFLASKEKSDDPTEIASSTRAPRDIGGTRTSLSSSGLASVTSDPRKSGATTVKTSGSSVKGFTKEPTNKSNNPVSKSAGTSKSTSSGLSVNSNNNVAAAVSKPESVRGTIRSEEIFEIPDDSFDEDFLDVCFDDVENQAVEKIKNDNIDNHQSSSRYGKVYVNPHAALPSGSGARRFSGATTARNELLPPPPRPSQTSYTNARLTARHDTNSSKIFPRSFSTDSFETTASSNAKSTILQQSQITTTTTATNQGRKFFKTKSLSTSDFDDHHGTNNRGKCSATSTTVGASSSKGWESNCSTKTSSVSTEQERNKTIKTSVNSSNNAWPRTINGTQHNTTGMYNFDRNAAREDGSRLKIINGSVQKINGIKDKATGSQLTQICTPEEIERKRMEAKKKLEMKRKLQARSQSAGFLSSYPTNRPVKR